MPPPTFARKTNPAQTFPAFTSLETPCPLLRAPSFPLLHLNTQARTPWDWLWEDRAGWCGEHRRLPLRWHTCLAWCIPAWQLRWCRIPWRHTPKVSAGLPFATSPFACPESLTRPTSRWGPSPKVVHSARRTAESLERRGWVIAWWCSTILSSHSSQSRGATHSSPLRAHST
jgi:hypothetical protein